MANVRHDRKESEVTGKVFKVDSTATFLVRRARYKDGKKVEDSKSETVPYAFHQMYETRIQSLGQLRDALADLHEHCEISIPQLVANFNHGLEYAGRDALAAGLDPSVSDKQRSTIDKVRSLLDDAVVDRDDAEAMLAKVGLTPEQIDRYLS